MESSTYQRLHRSVQRMSVVSSELGVGAFEGGISVGFWLLDTIRRDRVSMYSQLLRPSGLEELFGMRPLG